MEQTRNLPQSIIISNISPISSIGSHAAALSQNFPSWQRAQSPGRSWHEHCEQRNQLYIKSITKLQIEVEVGKCRSKYIKMIYKSSKWKSPHRMQLRTECLTSWRPNRGNWDGAPCRCELGGTWWNFELRTLSIHFSSMNTCLQQTMYLSGQAWP